MADKKLSRRKARITAMTHLYQVRMGQEEPEPLPDDELVRGICEGVERRREEIDKLILPRLTNWSLERIAIIDHLILQMAVCEMVWLKTAPKVAINEALELCKKFSAPESTPFINGVLDGVMRELSVGKKD